MDKTEILNEAIKCLADASMYLHQLDSEYYDQAEYIYQQLLQEVKQTE